jgi:DNA-binding NarL/FixJ family response regulator
MKRVVVADDHSLFRDGITSLLEAAGYDVVDQVGDGEAAIESVRKLNPDLILLDITMSKKDGIQALQVIKEEFPVVKVVILTVSDEDEDLFSAIQSGADGYLLKDLTSDEFLAFLEGMDRGEAAISRRMTTRLFSGFQELSGQSEKNKNQLTERELELLHLMAEGLSNKGIAEKLFISENTVKYHIRNILSKFGVQNRTEAVAQAIRQGLLEG